jgi:hypothetical protein
LLAADEPRSKNLVGLDTATAVRSFGSLPSSKDGAIPGKSGSKGAQTRDEAVELGFDVAQSRRMNLELLESIVEKL